MESREPTRVTDRHLMVAIPAYTGTIKTATFRSLVYDILVLFNYGWAITVVDDIGGAEIDTVRARIFGRFVASNATDLVMVDNDVGWAPGGLVRLLEHDVDFVCGVYPKRELPISFPFYPKDGSGKETPLVNGLIEALAVPSGFMRITRKCALAMAEAYDDLLMICSRLDSEDYPIWALFEHMYDEVEIDGKKYKKRTSEDLSFCRRWVDIGGKIWIDPFIEMGHIGDYTYQGSLGSLKDNLSGDGTDNNNKGSA